MCDPVSAGIAIGSTVLSAGGSMLNQSEQDANTKRAKQAARSKAEAEHIRQQQFQSQADQTFADALAKQGADPQNQQLAKDVATRQGDAATAINSDTAYNPPAQSAPTVVNSEIGRKIADSIARAKTWAGNKGKLDAWSDLGTNNAIDLSNTGANLGTINNLSRGSIARLQTEQEVAARNAQKPLSGFGSALQAGGAALGLAGATGAIGAASDAGGIGGSLYNVNYPGADFVGPMTKAYQPGVFSGIW